jgi:hypothetical protein
MTAIHCPDGFARFLTGIAGVHFGMDSTSIRDRAELRLSHRDAVVEGRKNAIDSS